MRTRVNMSFAVTSFVLMKLRSDDGFAGAVAFVAAVLVTRRFVTAALVTDRKFMYRIVD